MMSANLGNEVGPALGGAPRINQLDPAVGKIRDIARGQPGSPRLGNGCDLGVGVSDRPAEPAAVCRNAGKSSRRHAVESQDPAGQISANMASAAASSCSRRFQL